MVISNYPFRKRRKRTGGNESAGVKTYVSCVPRIQRVAGKADTLVCDFTMVYLTTGGLFHRRKTLKLSDETRAHAASLYPDMPVYDAIVLLAFGYRRVFRMSDGTFKLADEYLAASDDASKKFVGDLVYGGTLTGRFKAAGEKIDHHVIPDMKKLREDFIAAYPGVIDWQEAVRRARDSLQRMAQPPSLDANGLPVWPLYCGVDFGSKDETIITVYNKDATMTDTEHANSSHTLEFHRIESGADPFCYRVTFMVTTKESPKESPKYDPGEAQTISRMARHIRLSADDFTADEIEFLKGPDFLTTVVSVARRRLLNTLEMERFFPAGNYPEVPDQRIIQYADGVFVQFDEDGRPCRAAQTLDELHQKPVIIGNLTNEKVFQPNGITNLSDLQKVFDCVEAALVYECRDKYAKPSPRPALDEDGDPLPQPPNAIDLAFEIARDLLYAMDDSEERDESVAHETKPGVSVMQMERIHVVPDDHWEKLSRHLDKLDGMNVIDPAHPGDILGAAAKLKVLLEAQAPVKDRFARYRGKDIHYLMDAFSVIETDTMNDGWSEQPEADSQGSSLLFGYFTATGAPGDIEYKFPHPVGMYAVCDDEGIISYHTKEGDAFIFRMALINHCLNGLG